MAGKRRRGIFDDDFFGSDIFGDDIFGEFARMEERMRRLMRGIEPGDLKEGGPIVYGFNVTTGPDGKPVVQEFGNVRPTTKGTEVSEKREPLVDVIEREEDVTVIAELPGVEKQNIKLHVEENALVISVEGGEQKYFKRVRLPAAVREKESKATCKNGVLEVVLKKREKSKPAGTQIRVE